MNLLCPRCQKVNPPASQFCNKCGAAFVIPVRQSQWQQTPPNPNAGRNAIIFFGGLIGVVLIFAIIASIMGNNTNNTPVQQLATVNNNTSTPTPEPKTPPEFLAAAKTMLAQKEMDVRDKAKEYLKQIPKDAAEYKEAQKTLADALKKDVQIKREAEQKAKEEAAEARERSVIGERPSDADLYVAFNRYLRPRLNDYSSSEYVNYTSAYRTTLAGQPYWASVLKLRAKNAFGGYIVKDVTMYIRNKEVVLSDGL